MCEICLSAGRSLLTQWLDLLSGCGAPVLVVDGGFANEMERDGDVQFRGTSPLLAKRCILVSAPRLGTSVMLKERGGGDRSC